MKFDLLRFNKTLAEHHITVVFSGPIWAEGIDGMAEMLQSRLDLEDLPLSASQSIFSVFIEQMNNMMMYSAAKEGSSHPEKKHISQGTLVFGAHEKTFFLQSGNVIRNSSVEILKRKIDYLNTLDKKELRQFYKKRIKAENDNPESRGAGIGFIEIARRASSRIEYEFTPYDDDLTYFTMHVTI